MPVVVTAENAENVMLGLLERNSIRLGKRIEFQMTPNEFATHNKTKQESSDIFNSFKTEKYVGPILSKSKHI